MNTLEKDKILEKIYYDVDEGFGSARDLYEKARKVFAGVTHCIVYKWMRAHPKYEFQIYLMDVSSFLRDAGVAKGERPTFGMVCVDILI